MNSSQKDLTGTNFEHLRLGIYSCIVVIVVLTLSFSASGNGQEYTSTAGIFLVGTDARPMGMGKAYAGLAEGPAATFYNPAGLTSLDKGNLSSFYSTQYNAVHYGSITYAQKYFGLSYLGLNSGNLEKRDLYGNPTGEFSYRSHGLIGAYAKKLGNLSVGLQGKAFYHASPGHGLGYALSPALLYRADPFQFGAVFKNLVGLDVSYENNDEEPWQEELTLAVAYVGEDFNIDVDVDAQLSERGIKPELAKLGAEASLIPHVILRAGITSKLRQSLGLSLSFGEHQLDYCYQLHDELPSTHRISLVTRFEVSSIFGAWNRLKDFTGDVLAGLGNRDD